MPPDKHKLLAELAGRRRNVRFNELEKLMSIWGFTSRETKHGVRFTHEKYKHLIVGVAAHTEKGQDKKVRECYVKGCIEQIEELKFLEASEEGGVGNGD